MMIELRGIKKDYPIDKKPFPALKGIDLAFPENGFVSILGPSGCGKTTLLNILGGLDKQTEGDFLFRGTSTKEFKDRDYDNFRNKEVGFVFQSYNLIPHENVLHNVELPLTLAGIDPKERAKKAKEAIKRVGLEGCERKRPNQLSGGQMQRVAIARAIVNGPSLILADEPTGALDSTTSVQVLEILKEISKDRLVIMVTHNQELAEAYSTRIIKMRDGLIESDSPSLGSGLKENANLEQNPKKEGGFAGKKSSMSVMTAFLSSFKSIGKKKTRTLLTGIASSIGIIGVALVFAITNGFSSYVAEVEGDIASSVPIQISPTQVSSVSDSSDKGRVAFPKDDNLIVYTSSSSSYVSHRNNYDETYLRYLDKAVEKGYASSIMYKQEYYDFHLLTHDGLFEPEEGDWGIKEVNVYDSAANMSDSLIANISALPRTVFHEIYGDEKTIKRNYDVIYGKYPESMDEVVLVTDKYNRVPINTLKSLGIVSSKATSADYLNSPKIAFSDIVYDGEGDEKYLDYKCYLNSDFYRLDNPVIGTYDAPCWKITKANFNIIQGATFEAEEDTKTLTFYEREGAKEIYDNDAAYHPIPVKVVGVIRPNGDSILKEMPASLAYLPSLKEKLTADTYLDPNGDTSKNGKGAKLIETVLDNRLLARDDANPSKDGLNKLRIAADKIASALSGDTSFAGLQSTLRDELGSVYEYPFFTREEGRTGYSYYTGFNGLSYMVSQLGGDFRENEISYFPAIPSSIEDDDFEPFLEFWSTLLTSPEFYNSDGTPHSVVVDKEGKKEMVEWGAMDFLAYASSFARISSILIFPASISAKTQLRDYLDAYNVGKADVDRILYRDQMFDITSVIGTLVTSVSLGLSLLAGISLLVSSIMTGIITYVSVIERTKEIGILRACGARKRDVGRLFVAECFFIGAFAGLLGIGVAYGISFPLNSILCSFYPEYGLHDLVSLTPLAALILFLAAILLALIASFLPSRIAAGKDPVVALRSE